MNRRTRSFLAAILMAAAVPAAAQWLNVPAKGIPRTKDGKPDLSAPATRKPDGKPDLSGLWQSDMENLRYGDDIAADFKPGESPVQPWAEALARERMTNSDAHAREKPDANCLPLGLPQTYTSPTFPFKIIQESNLVVILYELFEQFRQIFLDDRSLPKDPNPTWLGYSVGRWDGDVLVVDTNGFNGKKWLDQRAGHPSTDALHFTERFRRRDFGHLEIQLTIDDPKAYTKPWTATFSFHLSPDNELIEFVCNENEKDLKHMPGK
jgi:hypothetical protein